ncbi:uncharacterized protein [Macrobrachium rosenbergii]|uniref:uncharacterized protein n=1 Tax=Macrobrachium rosenbergii TaxID=79674 RepID=UPI0034D76A53
MVGTQSTGKGRAVQPQKICGSNRWWSPPPPKPLSEVAVAVESILGVQNVAISGLGGHMDSSAFDFGDESEEQVEEACEVMSDAVDVTFEGDISTVLIPTSTPSTLSRHPQSSVPASSSSSSLKRPLFPLLEDTFRAKKQKAELAFWEAKIAAAEAERAAADAKRKAFELEAF